MRIIMPLMLVVGYEQIIIIQMLSPMRKDKAILINSCFGAVISLLLNITIVPFFASVGSAIVWFCSEMAVLLSAQFFVTKYVGYRMPIQKITSTLLVLLPIIICVFLLNRYIFNEILSLFLGTIIVFIYY